MDLEIAWVINRAHFHQKAPAHSQMLNAMRNGKGVITAIDHQNATAVMALAYREVIITAARTVDKGAIDVGANESWERLTVHAAPLVRYIGKFPECLQKMQVGIHVENEGVVISDQVRWPENPHTIKERRHRGEKSVSSFVFVVKGDKDVRRLVNEGIKVAGVSYRVEPFINVGPDSRCEHCRGWAYIESKYSGKPTSGYCSGPHCTSTHIYNVVGYIVKQGSHSGHTREKCPNCNGSHIAFRSRCAKKVNATREAWERRRREPAEWIT